MTQAGTVDTEKAQLIERPARPDDAIAAVDLIYLPMGGLADYLFGNDNAEEAKHVLRRLFVQEQNRFSYRFADVIEIDDEVAALLLSYPAPVFGDLAIPTGKEMAEVLGAAGMARMIKRSAGFMRHTECQSDEYYVFTVAVSPDHQNNGIGKQLLAMAQRKAIEAQLAKISLGVTLSNHAAVRFYSRIGFEIVETVKMARLGRLIAYPGYYKMVAKLPLIGIH
ncbi:MAG TPA: GNAT family N-acetyltransferase [Verrucomicrobiae bacterium]